ncbi:MAG: 4Fe-4S binding protein [Methanobrevibacter sp.]|jgi:epoxyqueuosine reductase QueG|nr:4Fe-4S binding protein [Candidatus Methanoflexus mossambicus]
MKNNTCCNEKEDLKDLETLNPQKDLKCCGCYDKSTINDKSMIRNPKTPKKEINIETIKNIEKKAKELDIVNISYVKIPEEVLKANHNLNYSNAIVFTMAIGMDIINKKASDEAKKFNDKLYEKFGNATYLISDELRKEGFQTQIAHPKEDLIDLTKLGYDSGLGYTGKSGLLISPELGPRMKISAILTSIENLPFSSKNEHEWIKDYCKLCSRCIRSCPQNALIEKENTLLKADLIKDNCIGCSQGCTYCIEACPFYEIGYDVVKAKYLKLESNLQ